MEKEALVIAVEDGSARVRMMRHSACAKCGACTMGGVPEMELVLPTGLKLQPGDRVLITMNSAEFLRAAILVYLIPLIFFILGYLAGAYLFRWYGPSGWEEAGGVATGFFLLILSYLGIHRYDRRLVDSRKYQLKIAAVIERSSAEMES